MLSISKTRWNVILQSSAVFIVLSASVQAEPLQCYWCGPLAEQVHRSRRAPPCDAVTNPVTSCDPGYDHCAVIASSPPYTESRLCVKLYQDECYPVYCNTTKTWRMTCPCRGVLCNGPNMERERESFALLAKLVAKTRSPIKKRSVESESDLSEPPTKHLEDNNLIQNSTPDNIVSVKVDMNDLKGMGEERTTIQNFVNTNTPMKEMLKNEISSNIVTPSLHPVTEQNNQVENDEADQMQSDQARPNYSDVKNDQPKDAYEIVSNKTDKNMTMPVDEKKPKEPEMESNKTIDKENTGHAAKEVEITTAKVQIAKEENPHMSNSSKPNAKLPPAQALQQDSHPITTTEKTETTMPTTLTTETHTMTDHTTTKPTKNSKNNAVGICLHLVLIVKWIIVYLYS